MAVLTAILSPADESLQDYRLVLEETAKRVLPACLDAEQHTEISRSDSVLTAVHGRQENVLKRGTAMLAGIARRESPVADDDWPIPGGPVPDGSFVLVRSDRQVLEALTDFAGSKSVWHARLKCGGIAVSTSFEVIVSLLGDFSVDEKALGWFLSSGSTGPRRSWDKRIKPVPRNSVLRIEIDAGVVTQRISKVVREKELLPNYDVPALKEEIENVVSAYSLGESPWLLALSGGHDSRALLYGTRNVDNITCVTWVDEASENLPESDVAIARQLAAKAGRNHEVKVIERPGTAGDLEQSLRRFARYSDGRNDNVLAYMDGMSIWDEISAGAAGGLLRGDELFGSSIALSDSRIRHNMRLDTFEDYAESPEQRELAGRHRHKCPSDLMRRSGESVSHWRLRLRTNHEIPVVYSALNAIRSRFIDSCCPLLDRRLVEAAASIQSHHLDERALYVKAVASMYPEVPIAKSRSTLDLGTFLRLPPVAELILGHLDTEFARDNLGSKVIHSCETATRTLKTDPIMSTTGKGSMLSRKIAMPLWAKRLKRRMDSPLDLNILEVAFRSCLARIIIDEMTESARLGAKIFDNRDRAIA